MYPVNNINNLSGCSSLSLSSAWIFLISPNRRSNFLRSVAEVFRGAAPYLVLAFFMLGLITFVPYLSLVLIK